MGNKTFLEKCNPKKILIIRLSSIGDIILASPLIRLLKTKFPPAQIDFVIKKIYFDLVSDNPYLNDIKVLDTNSGFQSLRQLKREIRAANYDLIIDIHKNFRSFFLRFASGAKNVKKYNKMRWQRFLLIKTKINLYPGITPVYKRYLRSVADLGIVDDNKGLEFFISSDVQERIQKDLRKRGLAIRKYTIGIAPGAGFATKRWFPERFAEIADVLQQEYNASIILFGDKNDLQISQIVITSMQSKAINITGEYSLMESAAALNCCDIVISNDTGLMHLASALGKKVVAIFGATTEELGFFPVGVQSRVVQHNIGCRPCTHIGSKKCPKGHFKCMKLIDTNLVLQEVKHVI